MTYERIEVEPVAGALGAEIRGADLRQIDDETFREVYRAWLEFGVIFFRNQPLTFDQQEALTTRFGPWSQTPFIETLPDHPRIMEVRKDAADRGFNFGGSWHSDYSFMETPPSATLLHAKEVPSRGGDTLWASQYRAYETLSDGMKAMLSNLTAVHSAAGAYGSQGFYASNPNAQRSMTIVPSEEGDVEMEHPVVRTHAETGRKALFVNAGYTQRFANMTKRESQPLLDFLFAHATYEAFTCRFRWEPDSLAIWDNRCVQHMALNDYHGEQRLLHRTTVRGERPA